MRAVHARISKETMGLLIEIKRKYGVSASLLIRTILRSTNFSEYIDADELVTVNIDDDLVEALEDARRRAGIPRAELLRRILEDAAPLLVECAEKLREEKGAAKPPSTYKWYRLPLPTDKTKPLLMIERVKKPVEGYTAPGPEREDLFREILDKIPLYTTHRHMDAYHHPQRYGVRAVARAMRGALSQPILRKWAVYRDERRVGWLHKGWIVRANTKDRRRDAIFKTATTDEIIDEWLNQPLPDIHPLRNKSDLEWHIKEALRRWGPSTAGELYNRVVLENPHLLKSAFRVTEKTRFRNLLWRIEGVEVVGKKKVGGYWVNLYALQGYDHQGPAQEASEAAK